MDHVEGFQGVGIEAGADVRTGTFLASEFTASGWLHAHAALGARFSPVLQQGHLSIRPVVNWHGVDILQHRSSIPTRTSDGGPRGAELTILVQSSEPDGGTFNVDGMLNVSLWSRSERTPWGHVTTAAPNADLVSCSRSWRPAVGGTRLGDLSGQCVHRPRVRGGHEDERIGQLSTPVCGVEDIPG